MNINELFQMQKALDTYIEKEHGLEEEDLFQEKTLALLVEIGELANETRCFKFWSKKSPSEKDVILEEFVDGVHFILSLGIALGIKNFKLRDASYRDASLTEQFLNVYHSINDFTSKRSVTEYDQLVHQYFYLGESLGFSHEEVVQAYKQKNEVNYRRQEQGY
ncbi:dUTPase [Rossellomorea vietnamensis]|uniref:dUTPase n=1 Tax=Rossellomorea vietnamensis TaxID=218284 RepID=A0A5D4P1L2_9BACI|nr:dUTP diphosphatase [Rossellomorea vietnamensis]TYS19698.1 dUTPase [Rossellomorea vietnamensis]